MLSLLEKSKFDIILLDIMLPDGGKEITQENKKKNYQHTRHYNDS